MNGDKKKVYILYTCEISNNYVVENVDKFIYMKSFIWCDDWIINIILILQFFGCDPYECSPFLGYFVNENRNEETF